jgi:hypothetical protein
MPYPNSFDVFDGMPTAYQHYNNLRADALRFGQNEADAVTIGELMALFESNLNLEIIEPKRLRVAASAAAPVGLMIGGYPLVAAANIDLPAGSAPVGIAAEYYIFAVRSDGQTGFSLDVNTTPTETSARRIIGRFYYDGVKIVKESIRTLRQDRGRGALNGVAAAPAGGRLTLVSGNATGDAGASSTIFYTPYESGQIGLYVPGFGWRVYSFSEAALPLDGMTGGNYDIFGHNVHGEGAALSLAAVKWATDAARSVAIIRQNGIWVQNNAPEMRYLGTIRLYASSTTVDDAERRFVWNCYNRQRRHLFKRADAASWSYMGGGIWRAANGSAANRVEAVVGLEDTSLDLAVYCSVQVTNGSGAMIGLARDAIGAPTQSDANIIVGYGYTNGTVNYRLQLAGLNQAPVAAGYHYWQWMEWSNGGTATFYGQDGASGAHGISGVIAG